MRIQELLNGMKQVYFSHFPRSQCSAILSVGYMGYIMVRCFLAGDTHEVTNGYWENDMFNIAFTIDCEGKGFASTVLPIDELPSRLQMSADRKCYYIKPTHRGIAYGSKSATFRKTTGDAEKILKTFDKFLTRLKVQLKEDLHSGLIADKFVALLRQKIL